MACLCCCCCCSVGGRSYLHSKSIVHGDLVSTLLTGGFLLRKRLTWRIVQLLMCCLWRVHAGSPQACHSFFLLANLPAAATAGRLSLTAFADDCAGCSRLSRCLSPPPWPTPLPLSLAAAVCRMRATSWSQRAPALPAASQPSWQTWAWLGPSSSTTHTTRHALSVQ